MSVLYLHVHDPEKIELIETKVAWSTGAIRALARLLYNNIGRGAIGVLFKYLLPNLTGEQYRVLIDERLSKLRSASDQEILNLYREVENYESTRLIE